MINTYEKQKVELLTLFRREMNGAVVDAMKSYDQSSHLNSYGVSVPTIKKICSNYSNDHGLAQHLFRSKVRELKLAAIFLDIPSQVTTQQIELWSEDFGSFEVMFHCSRLFATSAQFGPILDQIFAKPDDISLSLGLLLIAKSTPNDRNINRYTYFVLKSLHRLNPSTVNSFTAACLTIFPLCDELPDLLRKSNRAAAQQIIPFLG